MVFIGLGIVVVLCVLFYSRKFWMRRIQIPKIAWIYWDSDKPLPIQQIEANTRQKLSGWDIRYLDANSVKHYVSEFPAEFYALSKTHQSDWIRLKLLDVYGGCWIDAGIIINDGLAIDRMRMESMKIMSQFTVFKSCSSHFTTTCGITLPLAVDNFFIMAPANSNIIKRWLAEFEKAMSMGFLNYKRKTFADGINLSNIHFESEDDVYLTQHICIQRVLQEMTDYPPMIIMNSCFFMYKMQLDCNWDDKQFHYALFNDPIAKKIPYIKLISRNRKDLDLANYFHPPQTAKEKILRKLLHLWLIIFNPPIYELEKGEQINVGKTIS